MSLSPLQYQYLKAMGIQPWQRRATRPDAADAQPQALPLTSQEPLSSPTLEPIDWQALQTQISDCTRCSLHQTRTQTVFGVGNPHADWLIIGEAPGAEEDRRGEPFVGRAGQLLDAMLQAIGLNRQQVYIANILKCRPPNNRDPQAEEVAQCEPYLEQQIAHIQPRLILAVGRIAAQNLLKTDTPLGRLRGRLHHYGERRIPTLVTYHPAYLLRSPADKRKAWADLQLAVRVFHESQERGS